MSIKNISIEGFKSIKKCSIELNNLNILIGQNGAGKSNFISVFELLRAIVNSNLQLYVSKSGLLDNLFFKGLKTTEKIHIKILIDQNYYEIELEPTKENKLIFSKETCQFDTDYSDKKPYTEDFGAGHEETNIYNTNGFPRTKVSKYTFEKIIQGMKVYHFHDTSDKSPMKQKQAIDDNSFLRNNGSNIAPYLFYLKKKYPENYDRIFKTIKTIAPFIQEFVLNPDNLNNDFIQLEWKEVNSDNYLNAHSLSDGTLRFICLATLLLKPIETQNVITTIVIDEPELGLHPNAIRLLGSIMKSVSKKQQIIVSTQSTTLLNQFSYENIIVVEHDSENGIPKFKGKYCV